MLNSLDVECPACGAKVGEPCKTLPDKAMHGFHTKRKNAALTKMYPSEDLSKAARIAAKATEEK